MTDATNTTEVSMDQASAALDAHTEAKKAGRKAKSAEAKPAKEVNPLQAKYPALSATFLRGKFEGQLDSAFKDRETNADKATQYIAALQNGDVSLPEDGKVTRVQADKLKALGMEVDEANVKAGGRGLGSDGKEKAAAGNPDYPALPATFLRGKFKGQVASAHKDREAKPEKAADYIRALIAGVCPAPEGNKVTKAEAQMLVEMGHTAHGYEVQAPAPKPEKAPKADAAEGEAKPKASAKRGGGKKAAITE